MGRHHHWDDESFPHGGGRHFGPHAFRATFGPHGPHGRGWGGGPRARRGDVRAAVLRLLSEGPMHGYQIIQELTERTGGAWRPSPGSVYPTLQLLEDEGLVASNEADGKRVYGLTEEGRRVAAERGEEAAPWEDLSGSAAGLEARKAVGRLFAAFWQVAQSGSADQTERAVEILNEARKKLYAILAED